MCEHASREARAHWLKYGVSEKNRPKRAMRPDRCAQGSEGPSPKRTVQRDKNGNRRREDGTGWRWERYCKRTSLFWRQRQAGTGSAPLSEGAKTVRPSGFEAEPEANARPLPTSGWGTGGGVGSPVRLVRLGPEADFGSHGNFPPGWGAPETERVPHEPLRCRTLLHLSVSGLCPQQAQAVTGDGSRHDRAVRGNVRPTLEEPFQQGKVLQPAQRARHCSDMHEQARQKVR